MRKGTIALSMVFALLLAGSESAATPTEFLFQAPFGTERFVEGQALLPQSGDPSLTVRPRGRLIGGTPSENANFQAILGDWGLGVLDRTGASGQDRSQLFRRIHVDGVGNPEMLRLEFSQPVQIRKVVFSFVGPFEKTDLAIDGVDIDLISQLGTDEIYRLAPPGMIRGLVELPETLPFGRTWDFLARNATDEWNIESVVVQAPEPSSLVSLFALGFVGSAVGYRRWRRRQPG